MYIIHQLNWIKLVYINQIFRLKITFINKIRLLDWQFCRKSLPVFIILAGSDIISTFTYQASIEGFTQHLNKTETESINLIKSAVGLARTAIEKFKETHPELSIIILI